ncbi:MAG: hypothetical protein N2248_00415 [candidate division WOR-3 bacterium]|nr:hypothetical protein [candidate division WOR-3 bacterium]
MKTKLISILSLCFLLLFLFLFFYARTCHQPSSSPHSPLINPPVQQSRPLIGTRDQLLITVPPSRETTKIVIDDRLIPSLPQPRPTPQPSTPGLSPQSQPIFLRRTPLIRFHPTFHFVALSTFNSDGFFNSCAFGIKLRPIEIQKFGIAGYLTHKGPGLGIDFRLISNLSCDAACIWRIDSWRPLPSPLRKTLYIGLSIRL